MVLTTNALLLLFLLLGMTPPDTQDGGWTEASLPFRALAVTHQGETFWASGSGGGIASSADGKSWTVHHAPIPGGALLLGIEMRAGGFGYTFGSGGVLLTTADGGATWTSQTLGTEPILTASFADAAHGVYRTAGAVFFVAGGAPQPLSMPGTVPADFKTVPSLVALSADRMAVEVAEGWRARSGFVSTVDGGKTWTFYEPPHIVTYQLLGENGKYWAVGTETVDYDKPNGGFGVPSVMQSDDGRTWEHGPADAKACHWHGCHACTTGGCLASASLIVDPFQGQTSFQSVPEGHLTATWAAKPGMVCSVDRDLYCTATEEPADPLQPGKAGAMEAPLPPLGTKVSGTVLRCIRCALDPVFLDSTTQGPVPLQVRVVVGTDGLIESAAVTGAPTPELGDKVQTEVMRWVYEPPVKDGRPVKASTQGAVVVNVRRVR